MCSSDLGLSSASILETCNKHETKVIYRTDWYWNITASGHPIENGYPIKDSRSIDFPHQNLDCLGFFRKGKRVIMLNDFGMFSLKLQFHNRILEIVLKSDIPNHIEVAFVSYI